MDRTEVSGTSDVGSIPTGAILFRRALRFGLTHGCSARLSYTPAHLRACASLVKQRCRLNRHPENDHVHQRPLTAFRISPQLRECTRTLQQTQRRLQRQLGLGYQRLGPVDIQPGIYRAHLDYTNIALPEEADNLAILSYNVTIGIKDNQTGETTSSYVPDEVEPEPIDEDDEGESTSCACPGEGDDSPSPSARTAPGTATVGI